MALNFKFARKILAYRYHTMEYLGEGRANILTAKYGNGTFASIVKFTIKEGVSITAAVADIKKSHPHQIFIIKSAAIKGAKDEEYFTSEDEFKEWLLDNPGEPFFAKIVSEE